MDNCPKIICFFDRLSIWFFYAFLASSTLSVRKVLFFYPIDDQFNEYTGIYIYASDIFLALTLLCWIFALCNKRQFLSIYNSALSTCCTSLKECKMHILRLIGAKSCKNESDENPKCSTPVEMFHPSTNVPRGTFYGAGVEHSTGQAWNILRGKHVTSLFNKKTYAQIIYNWFIIFPIILIIFSFASVTWSSYPQVAFFRSLKIFEFALFYFIFLIWIKNVPRGTFLQRTWKLMLETIVFLGLFEAIFGISQFVLQHSIGLFWLKESIISPEMSGVAKIMFNERLFVRSYGLFPHPNILGGFLVMSILSTIVYFKMFHVEHFKKRESEKCSTWNKLLLRGKYMSVNENNQNNFEWQKSGRTFSRLMKMFHVEQFTGQEWNSWAMKMYVKNVPRGTFSSLLVLIQILALSLTFSKSAIIGLFVAFFYLWVTKCFIPVQMFHVEHSTGQAWNIFRGRHGTFFGAGVEHFWKKVLLVFGIIFLSIIVFKPDMHSLFIKSLQERWFYINVPRGTFFADPLWGIGAGQFVVNLMVIPDIQIWQFQPVHNVFLLILSEFGFLMLFGFAYFLYRFFQNPGFDLLQKQINCSTPEQMFRSLCQSSNEASAEHYTKQARNNSKSINQENVPRGTFYGAGVEHFSVSNEINAYFKAILLAFTFIMLFDHYLWDIQQGQIMFWLVLSGAAAGSILTKREKML